MWGGRVGRLYCGWWGCGAVAGRARHQSGGSPGCTEHLGRLPRALVARCRVSPPPPCCSLFSALQRDSYKSDPNTPHVVVCGDINTSRLKALLGQFFHKSRDPDVLCPVVVLSGASECCGDDCARYSAARRTRRRSPRPHVQRRNTRARCEPSSSSSATAAACRTCEGWRGSRAICRRVGAAWLLRCARTVPRCGLQ